MNGEMIGGLVRHVLTFGGGILVSKGYLDNDTMLQAVAAITSLVGIGWSIAIKARGTVPSGLKAVPLLLVAALGLQSCTMFGVDPADSVTARQNAQRVVKALRIVDLTFGVVIAQAQTFCTQPANVTKWPCNTSIVATAVDIDDKVSKHIAKLDVALGASTSDEELFAQLAAQAWELYDDVIDSMEKLKGASPEATRAIGELRLLDARNAG